MPDTTLDALLSDPDPVAQLIAADWLEERGRELDALLVRLPWGIVWDDVLGPDSPWAVVVSIRRPYGDTVEVYRRESGLRRQCYCLLGTGAGTGKWQAARATPPPGLEDAVCRVLRRRLEEITGA